MTRWPPTRHAAADGGAGATPGAPGLPARPRGTAPWRIIAAASAGNALEFYDLIVFGYFARQIGDAFFPADTAADAQLMAWGTFAVAFIARPVGAVVLGSYADRAGRKASLTLAISLMLAGTAMMAFMPRHDSIGLLAPLGILLARLIQGFSVGGEFGGASAFMSEHAGQRRRGIFASFQFISQAASNILASLAGLALSLLMSPAHLAAYGFRLPFILGLLVGPVGLYLRRHVDETPEFLAAAPLPRPAAALLRHAKWRVALGGLLVAGGTIGTYVNIYIPSYAQTTLHLPAWIGFAVTLSSASMALLVTPLAAWWSDHAGRMLPSLVGAALMLVVSVPALQWAVAAPGLGSLMGAMLLAGLGRVIYSAPMPALLSELFIVEYRAVGMSLAYTLGVTVFGGITPWLCGKAIAWSGNPTAPGYIIAAGAALTLAALAGIARLR